ncbi:hypothetical protein N0V88_007773 [Collariella sp. IMI 366227]|nr:hypothetical protein N0V88_007773 [Collariella sp. IMI 366227]
MSPQSSPNEAPKAPKGKAKARRVSNLSEEQRNKKRENDRIAQQNIRRRNKELIEKLQHEVEVLRKLDRVETVRRLLRRNKELEDEVHTLKKTLFIHNGRPYPTSAFDVDGLPTSTTADYTPSRNPAPLARLTSPTTTTTSAYDQWPSSVVPVPTTVSVASVESSPGASNPGDDSFTPAYVHTTNTSMPTMMDAPPSMSTAAAAAATSAPTTTTSPPTAAIKADYSSADLDPAVAASMAAAAEGSLRAAAKDSNRWSSLLA